MQKRILRGQKPVRGRPGASLPPADFKAAAAELEKRAGRPASRRDAVSYLIYPRVVTEFLAHGEIYGDTSMLPTPAFLYGPLPNEEITVEIEPGKTLVIKFLTVRIDETLKRLEKRKKDRDKRAHRKATAAPAPAQPSVAQQMMGEAAAE